MSCGYNCEYSCEECDVPDNVIEFVNGYNQALKDLLKELCIGCAYLEGTNCNNKYCPCTISQSEIIREVNKLIK